MKYQNNMLAYLNASTYNEISKGMDIRAGLYKKNFQEFITKQTDNMKKVSFVKSDF